MFKGVEVPEHSLVVRETVGSADADTLMCESDYSPCCTDAENGWFLDFDIYMSPGTPFAVLTASSGWFQSRDDRVVRLRLDDSGATAEGIFFCKIRVSADAGDLGLQTLYIGVYPSVDDGGANAVNGNGKSV